MPAGVGGGAVSVWGDVVGVVVARGTDCCLDALVVDVEFATPWLVEPLGDDELLEDDEPLEEGEPCEAEAPPHPLAARSAAPATRREIGLKLIARTVARPLPARRAATGAPCGGTASARAQRHRAAVDRGLTGCQWIPEASVSGGVGPLQP